MLMLTFYHGLRASELCHLRYVDVDLRHGRIWIARLKGSLSTEQPLQTDELWALKRYLPQRGDSQLPWLFLTERGDQFTRFTINWPELNNCALSRKLAATSYRVRNCSALMCIVRCTASSVGPCNVE
jgi:integrase